MCGGWRKADYSKLLDSDRTKISGLVVPFEHRDLQFTCVCGRPYSTGWCVAL